MREIGLGPVPGEEVLRGALSESSAWTLLFTDYLKDRNCTIFYLETAREHTFQNADKQNVTMKYLACIPAANHLIKKNPANMAYKIIGMATAELNEAVRRSKSKS